MAFKPQALIYVSEEEARLIVRALRLQAQDPQSLSEETCARRSIKLAESLGKRIPKE